MPELRRKRSRTDIASDLPSIDLENDNNSKPPLLAVVPLITRFPGILRAPIIALYDNTFAPRKDLLKLRTAEFRSTLDKDFYYVATASGIKLKPLSLLKE